MLRKRNLSLIEVVPRAFSDFLLTDHDEFGEDLTKEHQVDDG